MNGMLLMDPMIMSVLYVWCQLNKEQTVNFWFGTQFKANLLPWVLLGFHLIMGGSVMFDIVGILVGHLYYFLTVKYPETSGTNQPLISTPAIMYNYFPSTGGRGGFTGFQNTQSNAARPAPRSGGGYSWGGGNRLGRD